MFDFGAEFHPLFCGSCTEFRDDEQGTKIQRAECSSLRAKVPSKDPSGFPGKPKKIRDVQFCIKCDANTLHESIVSLPQTGKCLLCGYKH